MFSVSHYVFLEYEFIMLLVYILLLPIPKKKIFKYLLLLFPLNVNCCFTYLCTRLNMRESYILSTKCIYCFKWISKSILIISLHNISWMVFTTQREDGRQEWFFKYSLFSFNNQRLKLMLSIFQRLEKTAVLIKCESKYW